LRLPKFLTAKNPAEALALCRRLVDAEDDIVELDVRKTAFIDPFGLTLLGESLLQLADYGQRVHVIGLDRQIGAYLHRMDVFRHVELVESRPPPGQRRDRRDALSELKRIGGQDEAERVARDLADALVGAGTGRPATTLDAMCAPEHEHQKSLIQYVLSELLNNALTHSQLHGFKGKARVWTAAQYYPVSDKVRLAVADTGCGLLTTLKGHPQLASNTHFAAISAALQPRVSCNRSLGLRQDTVNEGVGLTTVHRLVDCGAGDMLVLTGNAYQRRRSGGFLPSGAEWQGVAIAVEIRRDTLRGLRIAELLPLGDAVPPELRFE
jgi:hypothetical protein